MIKRADEMQSEIRHKMRGGEGAVRIEHIFAKEELNSSTRLCARITLEPGSSIGYHEHIAEEEIFYIISGTAEIDDNGTKKEVGPGDAVLTGNGAGHAVRNIGQDNLEMLAVIIQY